MNDRKIYRKNAYGARAREFVEDDYLEGVRNEAGEQVMRALTPAEKLWWSAFNDAYYGNNVAKNEDIIPGITAQKKLINDSTNARNRCAYSLARATVGMRELDRAETIETSVRQPHAEEFCMEKALRTKDSLSDVLQEILDNAAVDLLHECPDTHEAYRKRLLSFYSLFQRAIWRESRATTRTRQLRKIALVAMQKIKE